MKSPLVSIIIVTYNSKAYLKDCLESVLKNSYSNFEIFIFDNHSRKDTIKIIKNFSKKYPKLIKSFFSQKNLGYAEANNLAVTKAKGEYLFFLNPDTKVEKNFLKPLVRKKQSNKKIAVCQPLIYLFDRKTINLAGKVTHYLGMDWINCFGQKKKPKLTKLFSFSGCAFLIDRATFLSSGGFDGEYFMYYEDSDLAWRLNLLGLNMALIPDSIVYHDYKYVPKKNYQSLAKKTYFAERNRLFNLLKNYELNTLLFLSPMILLFELAMIVYSFVSGWGLIKLRIYQEIFAKRNYLQKQRKLIGKLRKVSDKQLFQNMESEITFINYQNFVIKYFLNPIFKFYYNFLLEIL